MKKFYHYLIILSMLYLPYYSLAWGQTGHRIIGEIADKHLNTKARAAIQKILGTESIAIASNWGDFIKSDSNFKYLDTWHYVNYEKNPVWDWFL